MVDGGVFVFIWNAVEMDRVAVLERHASDDAPCGGVAVRCSRGEYIVCDPTIDLPAGDAQRERGRAVSQC